MKIKAQIQVRALILAVHVCPGDVNFSYEAQGRIQYRSNLNTINKTASIVNHEEYLAQMGKC